MGRGGAGIDPAWVGNRARHSLESYLAKRTQCMTVGQWLLACGKLGVARVLASCLKQHAFPPRLRDRMYLASSRAACCAAVRIEYHSQAADPRAILHVSSNPRMMHNVCGEVAGAMGVLRHARVGGQRATSRFVHETPGSSTVLEQHQCPGLAGRVRDIACVVKGESSDRAANYRIALRCAIAQVPSIVVHHPCGDCA